MTEEPPKYRICKECGEEKLLTDFVKAPSCKFGYRWLCKVCFNKKKDQKKAYERVKAWRKKNADHYKAYTKAHYKKRTATKEQRDQINLKAKQKYWSDPVTAREKSKEIQRRYRLRKGQKPRVQVNFDDGRICSSCNTKKPWSDYASHAYKSYITKKKTTTGYCQSCRTEKFKKQWQETKDSPFERIMRARAYSRYMKKNAARKAKRNNAYYHRHRDRICEIQRIRSNNLEDSYIRQLLRNEGHKTIPKTLIEVRRKEIMAFRLLKQYRKQTNAS